MPQGGMLVTNQDIGTVKRFGLQFDDGVFDPVAAATLYAEGTILGRVTADSKLRPYTGAATHGAGTNTPVGVLGTSLTSDGTPSDENIRYIVAGGVKEEALIIDGADPGVGVTEAIKDLLRDMGIVPLSSTDLSQLDNS